MRSRPSSLLVFAATLLFVAFMYYSGRARDSQPRVQVTGNAEEEGGSNLAARREGDVPRSHQESQDVGAAAAAAPVNCVRGGCSGELCAPQSEEVASICVWQDYYECFRTAACEPRREGSAFRLHGAGGCAWRATAELDRCYREKTRER